MTEVIQCFLKIIHSIWQPNAGWQCQLTDIQNQMPRRFYDKDLGSLCLPTSDQTA
ncbi:hypothetical protein UUU_28080 [Klebsiella pneumoniae subsp. pneumoniae DSM 30104 = JCM 1662 = NBRC 14940]|nr:hypothetical protein UUU_28080 [Klebsiella pneumoniae subsp. pneumoniae DSM 30104 = JCM 1662 = NBRC 14940]